MSYSATVAYAQLRGALVNLPNSVSGFLFSANIPAQSVVLELAYSKGLRSKLDHVYVGWSGLTSSGASVEIDPVFADSVGLVVGQKVSISIHANPPQAHTVHLDPLTVADWEAVESYAQYLESWMLSQVRAVSLNQPITVFPSATATATLSVVKIEPDPTNGFAQINTNSEIIIAPKTRKPRPQEKSRVSSAPSTSSRKRSEKSSSPSLLLRGVPLPHPAYELPETEDAALNEAKAHQFEVYGNFDDVLYSIRGSDYVAVSVVQPTALTSSGPGSNPPGSKDSKDETEIPSATPVMAKLVDYRYSPDGHVGLSYGLSASLGITNTVGAVIRLEVAPKPLSRQLSIKIIVHPVVTQTAANSLLKLRNSKNSKDTSAADKKTAEIVALVKERVTTGPVTNRMQLPSLGTALPLGCVVELSNAEGWLLSPSNSEITIGSEVLRAESTLPRTYQSIVNPTKQYHNVVGIDGFLGGVTDAVLSGNGGTLVYGTRVAGKTVVLKETEAQLRNELIHTIWFSCGVHAEKTVQALKETLRKLFLEAAWYSPSAIIFDDLDKLIPAEVEHADSSKTQQLAEVFKQLVDSTSAVREISILASSQSKESLHSFLITSHVFEEISHLKSPDKNVREEILNDAVASLGLVKAANFDMLEIAGNTEGYQPGDLWTLVERANHETILANAEAETDSPISNLIGQVHFDSAMKDFVPSSLRGVKLEKSTVSWADIGGLKETKSVILETLEWPTKYAPIFANCPLRLRSGLLLYGYPGCGKTLLASAVAAQCGLNFISVKGPEILNKYIGASEQSVRDLFDRAQAAKPCILFFDEFDSIAPKRGHDSTGVTDRVVNQMLTQMDGAEGLDGVYVLAATSRPDLIDSALLRPGRLDKSLICDLPNTEDRLDILRAVTTKMKLAADIDLLDLAQRTDGLSGADLQALLYNAYLDAIHEVVDKDLETEQVNGNAGSSDGVEFVQMDTAASDQVNGRAHSKLGASAAERAQLVKKLEVMMKPAGGEGEAGAQDEANSTSSSDVVIEARHVKKSLADTKPSISVKERRKLAEIYHKFVAGRSGDMPTGTPSTDIGGRATLM